MRIEGKASALRLAEAFFAASIEEVMIALPDCFIEGQDLVAELSSMNVTLIKNRFADLGYAGSIMSGISILPSGYQGIFISPIDVLFKVELIRAIRQIAQSYAEKPVIIVPHCPLSPGHPVYLSHHFFAALSECHHFQGLHRLIEYYRSATIKLSSFDKSPLLNINDALTLQNLCSLANNQ